MILRYLHGWAMWLRAVRMARAKKHGAGRQSWRNALKMAACYRWIVDGQHRGGKPPRYLRPSQPTGVRYAVATILACVAVLIFCHGAIPVMAAGIIGTIAGVSAWRAACRESAGGVSRVGA